MAISYPYGFDVLKSYFQRVSENNHVPILSEFVSLNINFIARSSPKTNEKLNGTWNKRFVTAADILKIKESVVPLPSDNVEASVKFRPDCEYRCRPQPHYCESCKPTR
ncbi:7259_t:CDS:2 [Funneliformis geosporum]|nr:7259_t:CDS:2 [Funneliformis geosporum]